MSDFRNYLNEQLQRPSFKAEWDTLQPELTIAQAMIDARKESGLTQKQLSERTGIAQADIHIGENDNLKRIKIDNYQLDFDYDGTEYDFTVSADIKFDDAADTPPGN